MKQIWTGTVDGKKVRILQVDANDCIVEELVVPATDRQEISVRPSSKPQSLDADGIWETSDDETASHAYMAAFLKLRRDMFVL